MDLPLAPPSLVDDGGGFTWDATLASFAEKKRKGVPMNLSTETTTRAPNVSCYSQTNAFVGARVLQLESCLKVQNCLDLQFTLLSSSSSHFTKQD